MDRTPQLFQCQVQGHGYSCLQLVCVDTTCGKRGLVCMVCLETDHIKHRTMPLNRFLDDPNNLVYDEETPEVSPAQFAKSTKRLKTNLLDSLQRIRKDFNRSSELLQARISDVFNYYEQEIQFKLLDRLSTNKLTFCYEPTDSAAEVQMALLDYFEGAATKQQAYHRVLRQANHSLKSLQAYCLKTMSRLSKLTATIKDKFQKLIPATQKVLQVLQSTVKEEFLTICEWNRKKSHRSTKWVNRIVTSQTVIGELAYAFLGTPLLPLSRVTIFDWSFKIREYSKAQRSKLLLLGVALVGSGQLTYTQPEKAELYALNVRTGSFYELSHVFLSDNFELMQNDCISLRFDTLHNVLEFNRKGKHATHKMTVSAPPAGHHYEPIVLLSGGDSVQLLK